MYIGGPRFLIDGGFILLFLFEVVFGRETHLRSQLSMESIYSFCAPIHLVKVDDKALSSFPRWIMICLRVSECTVILAFPGVRDIDMT